LTSEKCEAVFPPEFIEDLKFWYRMIAKRLFEFSSLKKLNYETHPKVSESRNL